MRRLTALAVVAVKLPGRCRFVDKGASVMIPYVIGTSGADYDLWTALVARFADEGLDEVQP